MKSRGAVLVHSFSSVLNDNVEEYALITASLLVMNRDRLHDFGWQSLVNCSVASFVVNLIVVEKLSGRQLTMN